MDKSFIKDLQKRYQIGSLTEKDYESVEIVENVRATFSDITYGHKLHSYTFDGYEHKAFNSNEGHELGLCTKSKKIIKDNGTCICDIMVIKKNTPVYTELVVNCAFFKYNRRFIEVTSIISAKLSKE